MATLEIATIDPPATVDPISVLATENTTTLPTYGLGIRDEDLTELERLAINWKNCRNSQYYESMDFKEKIDKREASTRTFQVFWSTFQDLCENILQSPRGDGDIFSACVNL